MRHITLKLSAVLALAAILVLAYHVYKEQSRPFQEMPTTVTNFAGFNTDGEKSEYYFERGDATLIVLSANWCPACIAEIPILKKLHKDYSPRGFKILMISEDDNVKAAARFKKTQAMPWTVIHWNYDLMNALGNPRVLPVSYLVDGNDDIVSISAGIFDEKKMRSSIERILK